jgi:choline dehydrogenase-like flavoprotein
MGARSTEYDVVIVGSGAGGTALAQRLGERGLSMCMLERGPDYPQTPPPPHEQSPGSYTATPEELPHVWLGEDRAARGMLVMEGRTVGGGTAVFSGNMLRFHPQDFFKRTLLGDIAGASVADWPLRYEELEPYYASIEQALGVGGDAARNPFEPPRSNAYPASSIEPDRVGVIFRDAARELGWHPYPIPSVITPAHGRAPCVRCGACSGFVCAYGARWHGRMLIASALAQGRLELRTRATVTRVLLDRSGDRACGIEYLDAQGALERVSGRVIVLAANAVQTPRILLSSAGPRHPQGLANCSGMVGRNLMTHAHEAIMVAGFLPDSAPTHEGASCTIAIQDFYDGRGRGSPLAATLEPRAIGSKAMWAVMAALDPDFPPSEPERARYLDRFRTNLTVTCIAEDLPRADNRVKLSPELRDRAGLAVPTVTYRPHALDLETAAFAASRSEELLAQSGAAGVFRVRWPHARYYGFGTCRMGDRAQSSVVDRTGRCHDLDNLYIADGSVFVTSSGANPALTILALARRTADQIASRLRSREL